jgi:hypothetical protein
MKINLINRFWNESWINIVSESLNKRELAIENTNEHEKRVSGNRSIMDFAIELVDHQKAKNNNKKEGLHDINRVRLYKEIYLLFELV